MTEKQLQQKFAKLLPKGAFFYKIPDTHGLGGRRPFDAILIVEGKAFAIEFKVNGNKVTPFQDYSLRMFMLAGGGAWIVNEDNYPYYLRRIRGEKIVYVPSFPKLTVNNVSSKSIIVHQEGRP